MVHSSLGQVGWTVGGPVTVIRALLDTLGPAGTLVMEKPDMGHDNGVHYCEWCQSQRAILLELRSASEARRGEAAKSYLFVHVISYIAGYLLSGVQD